VTTNCEVIITPDLILDSCALCITDASQYSHISAPSTDRRTIKLNAQLGNHGNPVDTSALLDCGAGGIFISQDFVTERNIKTEPRPFPLIMKDAAGRVLGTCTRIVTTTLVLGNHQEDITLEVGNVKHPIILGITWLRRHNPLVDWVTGKISYESSYCRTYCLPVPSSNSTETSEISPEFVGQETYEVDISIMQSPEEDKADLEFQRLVKTELPKEYHKFAFTTLQSDAAVELDALPPHQGEYDFAINLVPGAKIPKGGRIYPMSDAEKKDLRIILDHMLKLGLIEPSTSPFAAPCFFVKKKDGSRRLIIDWRGLNDITIKDQGLIPRISNLLEAARGSTIFSKLDLVYGYHNLRIRKGDEYKTAFITPFGLFQSKVMQLGFTNAPAAFQRFMEMVLKPVLHQGVEQYIDDTLSHAKSLDDHVKTNLILLRQLAKYRLRARLTKCEFHKDKLEFLGTIIGKDGVEMESGKVDAIQKWPTPKSVRGVREFLGFAGWYRRFVKDFSSIARPLHNLEKKGAIWVWGPEEEEAFQRLKAAIISAPVLIHADPAKQYHLETDASGYAYGAVLSQKSEADKRYHPIAFMSKSMTRSELNYDIYDKELLAVIRALQHWRAYLESTEQPIDIRTDHKNLMYWANPHTFNARQMRWWHLLQGYNFKISYQPGAKSGRSDALSRREDLRPEEGAEQPLTMLSKEQIPDLEISEIVTEEEWAEIAELIAADDDILANIKEAIQEDPGALPILAYLKSGPGLAPASLQKAMSEYRLEDDLLLHRGKVYVPQKEEIKRSILKLYHDSMLAGHPGRAQTLELVGRGYYWPSMKMFINQYIDQCLDCQQNKNQHTRLHGKLQPLPIPESPWKFISYDYIPDLPKSNGFNAILVVVDRFTKMAHFIPACTDDTADIAAMRIRRNVWRLHGLPTDTVSDRGTQFHAALIKGLYEHLGIKPRFSTAYHPETDGQTE
jgi:hypothetical protein